MILCFVIKGFGLYIRSKDNKEFIWGKKIRCTNDHYYNNNKSKFLSCGVLGVGIFLGIMIEREWCVVIYIAYKIYAITLTPKQDLDDVTGHTNIK